MSYLSWHVRPDIFVSSRHISGFDTFPSLLRSRVLNNLWATDWFVIFCARRKRISLIDFSTVSVWEAVRELPLLLSWFFLRLFFKLRPFCVFVWCLAAQNLPSINLVTYIFHCLLLIAFALRGTTVLEADFFVLPGISALSLPVWVAAPWASIWKLGPFWAIKTYGDMETCLRHTHGIYNTYVHTCQWNLAACSFVPVFLYKTNKWDTIYQNGSGTPERPILRNYEITKLRYAHNRHHSSEYTVYTGAAGRYILV